MLELDRNILIWINGHHNVALDALLLPISYAGELAAIWFVVALGMLIFGKSEHRRMALVLILTIVAVDKLIAPQLAHLWPRERPYVTIPGIRQLGRRWAGHSFPSGHAHSVWEATVLLGCRWRKLIIPLVIFAVLTCYSRVYFGMHYPLDVIGGSILGITAGFIVVGIGALRSRRGKKVRKKCE